MKIIRLYIIFLLGSTFLCPLFAQLQSEQIALATYLKKIEKEYDVLFSYADEKLEDIQLPAFQNFNKLEKHLDYLQSNTPFDYLLQSETYILVVPKQEQKNVCVELVDVFTRELIYNGRIKIGEATYFAEQDGQFMIPIEAVPKLALINSEGYRSTFANLKTKDHQTCLKVYLHSSYEILEEVFLTNLLTKGIQKIASGGLEINYKEFGLLPGLVEPDVLQSLQALPGITSRKESVSYLNVRGGTHDQNLFLWDGIKMYNTSHFFGMISAFNPYMTEKVSLIKNGTSAKYGDGVSSLINMKTSNQIAKQLKAQVGVNLMNVDAIVEAPLFKNASIEFSSRQSVNSLWESPTYNRYFDKVFQNTEVTDFPSATAQQNDDFSFFDATLSYKHQLSQKDFIKANVFYAEDQFGLNRFELQDNRVNTRTSNLAQTNIAGGIFYERNWSRSTISQLQFYSSRYNQSAENINLLNQQRLEQINEVREIGFRLNTQTQLSSTIAIENGYQYNETGVLNSENINDPAFFSEVRNSILTHSIYSQLNYQSPNQLLNLNLGGRLNHFSKFDEFRFEPRFNLSYQFVPDLYIEVLAEQKSQVTSQRIDLQTDFLGVENRRWVLSNPENRPVIESQQISAGFNFIKSSWFINADLYYKKVDGITSRGQGFQNQFEFAETHGNYDVIGVDFLVNKNFDPISGWISYSWSENNYHFDQLNPSRFRNNLDLRHVVATGISYEKNGFKVSAGFNWHSGVVTTLQAENQDLLPEEIQFEAPNAHRLKDYFRLDVSSTYAFSLFKNTSALAGISFLNLLNNNNIYNEFYRIGANQNVHTFQQNGLRFTPNLLFRIRF